MNSFLSKQEIDSFGFSAVGEDVHISRFAHFYGAEKIHIGNHVRIDDFCILSGEIVLGSFIHLAANVLLFAGDSSIEVGDYSTLSSRCAVYAISDDYSGEAMTNPTVPKEFRNVTGKKVTIGKHVIVGTGSTILPGVEIGEGGSFGAMSLINKSTAPWGIYMGAPCRRIRDRRKDLLEYEKMLRNREER